jgi:hypothetical protein
MTKTYSLYVYISRIVDLLVYMYMCESDMIYIYIYVIKKTVT